MNTKTIWNSRKFRIAFFDAIAGIVILLIPQLGMSAEYADLALKIWGLMQPVLALWIVGIAVEDNGALKAGTHPSQE